ncbi:MAG: SDR family NAD(P)-dependent oxidoreductase [Proteobacteria bacterium]|nr:SDR family NAD(P)-dependent oxidoreductase [Pseudomonadota bacterium]
MGCLDEQVVIVTGAGRGIGRATALLCGREGARVLADDLGCDAAGRGADSSVSDRVANEIVALGGVAVASHEDVSGREGPRRLTERAMDEFGRLDAVIACAGVARNRQLLRMSDDDLDAVMNVQLRSSIRLTRAGAQTMARQGNGGSIVLSAGASALFGSPHQSSLTAAFAGLMGFARSAAMELRRQGIRVNTVAPLARTRLTENNPVFKGIGADSLSATHVAPVNAYLASRLSVEVSGEFVAVAGSRVYLLAVRETTGIFADGAGFALEELQRGWNEITRG